MRPTGAPALTPPSHAPPRSAGVTVHTAALGGTRVARRSAPARASRARVVACSAKVNKVVLAYSGGLDTSVILKWLQETYDCEVGAACCARGGWLPVVLVVPAGLPTGLCSLRWRRRQWCKGGRAGLWRIACR